MRISNIYKLAALPRCLDLFESKDAKGGAAFKLRNADIFGGCIHRGESIGWQAHVDPKSLPPVPHSRFDPSLHRRRPRIVVIDAHDECIRAMGPPGVHQELRENRQAVPAAFGEGAVGVDDQQAKSVFFGERSDQQSIRQVPLALGSVPPAADAFNRARRPSPSRRGGLSGGSGKFGEPANLVR